MNRHFSKENIQTANITTHHRNAKQNHSEVSLYICKMTVIKQTTNSRCWWECHEKGAVVHCWWACTLVQPLWKVVRRFFKILKIELAHNPAISLLAIFLKKTKRLIGKDICIPMFIAALLTIAKRRKQAKYPSRGEWVKRIRFTCAMEYYLALKKNLPISDNIDEPRGCYAKWNNFDREKQIPCDFTWKWNLKTKQVNKHNKSRKRLIYKDCQRTGVCLNRRWGK